MGAMDVSALYGGATLIGASALLGLVPFLLTRKYRGFRARAVDVQGTIVHVRSGADRSHYPTVEYQDGQGQLHTLRGRTSSSGLHECASMLVHYDADAPDTAVLDSDLAFLRAFAGIAIACAVVGLACIVAYFVLG